MNTTTSTFSHSQLDLRTRVLSAPVVLTVMVALATVVQFLAAVPRASVTYLPDEYLYSQLARSLGSGHGSTVLGESASLPAMFEPLLTAAFWGSTDAQTAIHLTQALHSLLMALAAVPVFLIARQLRLSSGVALTCALISLVAPGMVYASYLTADSLGYLVALVAIHAGVRAVARPTIATQSWFLVAAGLATFARLQYATLVPAFIVAVLVVERFRVVQAVKRFAVVATMLALGVAAGLVVGSSALGRYDAITGFGLSFRTLDWTLRTSAFLLVVTGAALAPPALAWALARLARPADRARAAYAAMTLTLVGAIVVASAMVSADTHSDRFLERYLLVAFPLAAIGFFCWIDEGRPAKAVVVAAAAVVIVAAARVPVTGDLVGQGSADSPTLHAISRFGGIIGLVEASMIAALVVSGCAVLALAAAFSRRVPAVALVVPSVLVLAFAAAGAHAADLRSSKRAFANAFGSSSTWVDDARPGPTLFIQTPESNPYIAMVTTIFNSTIVRGEGFGTRYVIPLDGLGKSPVNAGNDGLLREADGTPIRGSILLATGGSGYVAAGSPRVVRDKFFDLLIPEDGTTRLRAFAAGVRSNNSIAPVGWVTAYQGANGTCNRATLKLTLPLGLPPTTLEFRDGKGHRWREHIHAGRFTTVDVDSTSSGPATARFDVKQVGTQKGSVMGTGSASELVTNVATGHLFAREIPCRN